MVVMTVVMIVTIMVMVMVVVLVRLRLLLGLMGTTPMISMRGHRTPLLAERERQGQCQDEPAERLSACCLQACLLK